MIPNIETSVWMLASGAVTVVNETISGTSQFEYLTLPKSGQHFDGFPTWGALEFPWCLIRLFTKQISWKGVSQDGSKFMPVNGD